MVTYVRRVRKVVLPIVWVEHFCLTLRMLKQHDDWFKYCAFSVVIAYKQYIIGI